MHSKNRIVVDYKGKRELVLLGERSIINGKIKYPPKQDIVGIGWRTATFYDISDLDSLKTFINSRKGDEFEGMVGHWSDGTVSKFKSEDYMRLHRILAQFTFKRVLESMQDGTAEEVRKVLPEELLSAFDDYQTTVQEHVEKIVNSVHNALSIAPKDSRKELALYLQAYYKGTDIIRFAFKYVDLNYDMDELYMVVLKSLRNTDFDIEEKV